jgi:hypothetical protein
VSVDFHDAFDRRVLRHVETASEQLAEAERQVMAEYAARGLLRSGPRLKRQAQVRNEHLADLAQWCLSEVLNLPGNTSMHWNEHSHSIRGSLTGFMSASRGSVSSAAAPFGPAVVQAIDAILDKADANALAELDEFGAGVWRPRGPSRETAVTNNINVTNSTVGSIQQAGNNAHQQSANTLDIGSVQQALDAFDMAVADAELGEQARAAIRAEVETIRPQLSKPTPSGVIVRESMKTLRNVVEGLAAGALTPTFIALLHAAAPLIGAS